jgi:hypothetical protein
VALEEKTFVDKIEVLENGTIQVRTANQILKDGTEIASTFHRHVLSPGSDLTDQDPKVVAIANAVWTQEVIESYKNFEKSNKPLT